MTDLRIAGVPEHFNLPWKLLIQSGNLQQNGINPQWTNIPEGTGKMCQMLRNGETDVAVILTEGIIKDIIEGNPSKIVQIYVESPLLWGIHVAHDSKFENVSDLKNARVAISRPGSGSQLMAYVNAKNNGWPIDKLEFVSINTIDGAVSALTNNEADYFMWERFMTKPLVDKGIFRRIGECPTPWPSFVIAVTDAFLESHPDIIQKMLQEINAVTSSFKEMPDVIDMLATEFNQKKEDLAEWLSLTNWSENPLNEELLNKVQIQLLDYGVIHKRGTFADMARAL
ncbi:MAG: ABC transporter substrate-binding protein [Flavobacterium sp.]|nr:ABC transporter substrate-binding protein [Flavobacterium sp.]